MSISGLLHIYFNPLQVQNNLLAINIEVGMIKILAKILRFFKKEDRRLPTLADIRGVTELRKFIGKTVHRDGVPLGVVEKIVADKRKKTAKKVYVRKNGKLLCISPQLILLENGVLRIKSSGPRREEAVEREYEENLDSLSEIIKISSEIQRLKDKILKLDDKLIEGEIDVKTFKVVRKDLDSKIRELASKGKAHLKELKKHLKEIYKKKILLEKELEKYRIKLALREVKEEDIKGRVEALEDKIKELEKRVEKIRVSIETLEYYASEYIGTPLSMEEDLLSKIFNSR
ncbi:MAG: hypothetical protein DRJ37_00520 [Thermoprotei archaeon]|nr:MAG: hypothetical protein DRJ37_00520 [Thermoprotei archaeon]